MIDAPVKATRHIDKTPLNPDGRALRRMERDARERIHAALQKWGRSLFRGVTAETVALITARLDDPEYSKPLRDTLIVILQDVAAAGAEHGQNQAERVFMGVKAIAPPLVEVGGVDWTLANSDAAQWAIEYGYSLIRGITDTTRAQVAREIRYFVDNSLTVNQLRDRLMAGNLFSRSRAEAIAITEITRAFSAGNQAAWQASKVVEGKEWMTAYDEAACPICRPLSGKIVKLNEPFDGRIMGPPAHPRCRCWVVPVVIGDTEVLSEVGVGPWGAAANVAKPLAIPVADAIDFSHLPAGYRASVQETLRAIEQVHSDGQLPKIKVNYVSNMTQNVGEYVYDSQGNVIGINLSTSGTRQSSTLAHEIGHFLDHQAIGRSGRFASVDMAAEMEVWESAVKNSEAYKKLLAYHQEASLHPADPNYLNRDYRFYLLSKQELWARSYEQFIAEESGNEKLLSSIEWINMRDRSTGIWTHWESADFAPVRAAIREIFRARGWMS